MEQIFLAVATIILTHLTIIPVAGAFRMRAVRERLGGRIRSGNDFEQVRRALKSHLVAGNLVGVNAFSMVLMLVTAFPYGMMVFGSMLAYFAVLEAAQVIAWVYSRPIAREFKALPVESEDPMLADEYRWYVQQWLGFCVSPNPPPT